MINRWYIIRLAATRTPDSFYCMTVIGVTRTKALAKAFCKNKIKEKGFIDSLIIVKSTTIFTLKRITFGETK